MNKFFQKTALALTIGTSLSFAVGTASSTYNVDTPDDCGNAIPNSKTEIFFSQEKVEKYNNNDSLNYTITNLCFTIDPVTIGGAGSISDPIVEINISNFNSKTQNDIRALIDNTSTNDDIYLYSTATNSIPFDDVTIYGNDLVVFSATSIVTLMEGDKVCLVDTNINDFSSVINVPTPAPETEGSNTCIPEQRIKWDFYSDSGTKTHRDWGTGVVVPAHTCTTIPQFAIKCTQKFDGLINWEDTRRSFVTTKHSALSVAGSSAASDFQRVDTDVLSFKIKNDFDGVCDNFDFYLQGNETQIDIDPSIALSDANWMGGLFSLSTNVDGGATWTNFTPANLNAVPQTGEDNYGDNNTIRFTTHDEEIPANTETEYYAFLMATDVTSNYQIPEITFVGNVNLEGDATAVDVEPMDGAGETDYEGNVDATNVTVGEWTDYVYKATIPYAQITTGGTQTKLAIVNNSCETVKPIFIIKDEDGNSPDGTPAREEVVNRSPIAPNGGQQIFLLTNLLKRFGSPDNFVGSIEVIVPGTTAEEISIYAFLYNDNNKINRDLPVYDTNLRD